MTKVFQSLLPQNFPNPASIRALLHTQWHSFNPVCIDIVHHMILKILCYCMTAWPKMCFGLGFSLENWDCSWNGEQGWSSGESTRLPLMWPGFDSWTQRHMWVEFVGSLLCSERFFFGYSVFPLFPKTNIWFFCSWFDSVSPISTVSVLS